MESNFIWTKHFETNIFFKSQFLLLRTSLDDVNIKLNKVNPQVLFIADYATITSNEMYHFQVLKEKLVFFPHFLFLTEKSLFPESQEKTFLKLFESGIPDYSFEMSFFNRNNSQSAIKNMVAEKKIDLIIFQDLEIGL